MSFVFCFFDSCHVHRLEKNLDPESSDFISIARYIITPEEYKQFINLPGKERYKFMEDFWKRRDPDPETEENEFRVVYLARLAEAIEIFNKGASGYLSDRGMVYVIFGPPDYVYHPTNVVSRVDKVYEKWSYNLLLDKYPNVEIYFVDRFGSSSFTGSPGFSSGKFELARNASVISLMQEAKRHYLERGAKNTLFKYDIHLKKRGKDGEKVKLLIQIGIPYKNIWFSKVEDKMEAILSLNVKILDASKNKIWEHKQDYTLSVFEKKVGELLKEKEKHVIEIPTALSKGKYLLHVILADKTEGEEEKKVLPFKI